MNYIGVIIEESLRDKSILDSVKTLNTKIEAVTSEHKTPWLNRWTLHTVEILENKGDEIAHTISQSLDQQHSSWYADYKNDKYHYIIYDRKIFKVNLNNPKLYKLARKYGISIGIPDYQVDFAPEDKSWER